MNETVIVKNTGSQLRSPYDYLSKYRSVLMGVAILWVVWFHSAVDIGFAPIHFLKQFGYAGVDVFFLLSGMGIYISLEKNDLSRYIKNRVSRILPVWWGFLLIYILLGFFVLHLSMSGAELLGFATFTGFWLDLSNHGNWYIHAIMLLYLISPVLHSLLKSGRRKLLTCIVLVLISLVISLSFFGQYKLIVFSRIPLYIIGMYIPCALKDKPIRKAHWFGVLAAFILGCGVLFGCCLFFKDYLWTYGLWWYPFIVIAPTMTLLTAKFFDLFQRALRPLAYILSVFGKASLEILLISDYLFDYYEGFHIYLVNDLVTAILVVVIAFVTGIVFHRLIECITKRVKKLRRQTNAPG